MATNKQHRPVAEFLALLNDKDFCSEATQILNRLWQRWDPSALPTREEFDAVLPRFIEEHVAPFIRKWGALPPPFRELVAPDSRLKAFDMMVSGRFGLIPVLPWTTQPQILAAHHRIQGVIGRQHSDRQNTRRVQIAMWLNDHDLPMNEVARALWDRPERSVRSRRITPGRVTFEEEQRLIRLFMRQGLDYLEAAARFRRRLRRSETPKRAAIRMALSRYVKDRVALNQRIRNFSEIDAVSFGIARLLRATLETENAVEIQALAVAARNALVDAGDR